MLRLRSSVDAERDPHFAELLRNLEGVRRVVRQPDEAAAGAVVFTADVEPAAADRLVEEIPRWGSASTTTCSPGSRSSPRSVTT